MKRIACFLPLVAVMTSLCACTLFQDDGSWKAQYGTPELFLNQVQFTDGNHSEHVYLYEDQGRSADTDYVIKDAILAFAPFTEIAEKKPGVERFFTYEAYWIPATSGPNFCHLSIYDDGLMVIHHKTSLGPHGYLYFSMDAGNATALVDLAFSRLNVSSGQ